MRKIILNLAMSLDGYISDKDGGFEWIVGHGDNSQNTDTEFSFENFLKDIDIVVMGSKSYEDCILSGLTTFHQKRIIVATSREFEDHPHVEFINGDIVNVVESLKNAEGGDIFLFGGAGLTDSFIRADVIDKYIIGVIPTILGNGRSLFKGNYPKIDLHLDDFSVTDGIPIMTYSKR